MRARRRAAVAKKATAKILRNKHMKALDTAIERGLRSGQPLGADPAGRARVGWQKVFGDGSLASRTAALLADIELQRERAALSGEVEVSAAGALVGRLVNMAQVFPELRLYLHGGYGAVAARGRRARALQRGAVPIQWAASSAMHPGPTK